MTTEALHNLTPGEVITHIATHRRAVVLQRPVLTRRGLQVTVRLGTRSLTISTANAQDWSLG